MKNIAKVLKKSRLPALVVAKAGEVTDVVFRNYTVLAGEDETTVLIGGGNSDMHSPISGEKITPKEGVSETAAKAEDLTNSFPVIAHCTNCNHDTHATKELASAMDGVDFHCMNCGTELSGEYYADLMEEVAEDDSEDSLEMEDDSDETSEEDVTDALEDEEEDDESAEHEAEESEEYEAGEEEEEDETNEEDATCENASDETTSETTEQTSEDTTTAEDATTTEEAPATHIDVVAAKTIEDLDEDIRVVSASNKRFELFVGDTHIGHLNMDLASQMVNNLASNPHAFTRSVIMTLAKDLSVVQKTGQVTEDLSNFGLQLASINVPISNAVDQMVSEQVAAVEGAKDTAISDAITAFKKGLEIAMAGMNKGIIEGPNLAAEFAKTLRKFGVANALEEANLVISSTSPKFLEKALEAAQGIVDAGPDYARGLSQSIASAQYRLPTEVDEDPSLLTAATFVPKPSSVTVLRPSTPSKEQASGDKTDVRKRYASMFKSF